MPYAMLRVVKQFIAYIHVLLFFIAMAAISHLLLPYFGYRAIGLVFLVMVMVNGLFFSTGPIIFGAGISALTWDFLFIPPSGSLTILNSEDIVIIFTFIATSITLGVLTRRIRDRETQLNAKAISEKLYQTLFDSLSHELKTPLTSIIGSATALKMNHTLSPDGKDMMQQILQASHRMTHTIENLLDMSRLNTGMVVLKKEWHDPSDLVKAALTHVTQTMPPFTSTLHLPETLPLISVDFSLLQTALANIMVNAVRFNPPELPITIALEVIGPHLQFRIANQGPHIPAEHLPHIFERFYRIPSDNNPHGLGLGLIIAKTIAEAHNGQISVKNHDSAGVTFFIRLPILPQPELPPEIHHD